jgi:hypothetical protein
MVPPKRRQPPERYAKCTPKFFEKLSKNILTKYLENL